MSGYLPYVIIVALLAMVALYVRRGRARQAALDTERRENLHPGAAVMTTSGLYGVVEQVNADDTVQLRIAEGVVVRWAVAALRAAAELPPQYRPGASDLDSGPGRGP